MRMHLRSLLLIIVFYSFSCENIRSFRSIPMVWQNISNSFPELPDGIRIFSGRNRKLPLNAWYVEVDSKKAHLSTEIVVSNDADRRESPVQFAARLNAAVVLNGGYFLMHKDPSEHVGLLVDNGEMISLSLRSMIKRERRYFLTRSAIGFNTNGQMDIAWIASRNDSIFEWDEPANNKPEKPITDLEFSNAKFWNVKDAMQAGPVIVSSGRKNVTTNEEVFFWSKIPEIHPRTAAGYTKDGKYIFMVVDGRQPDSRGVDINELSILMYDLDCEEAINLDGGGSSAIVVNGELLNNPVGFNIQREVMSAIAVFAE
ncbi:MAG TPA: phosphodiester glycosidase family protein [Candidatus Marinimicrobia bacterium]|nr:phosphodiester glycosidase family protein [Candidatus Neomarinimicrobiota bacterium]